MSAGKRHFKGIVTSFSIFKNLWLDGAIYTVNLLEYNIIEIKDSN